jgi:ribosomal protein S1
MSELVSGDEDWNEKYADGTAVMVEIRRIDQHDRKISLSEKGAEERSDQDGSIQEYVARQGESTARLGDVLGDLSRKLGG